MQNHPFLGFWLFYTKELLTFYFYLFQAITQEPPVLSEQNILPAFSNDVSAPATFILMSLSVNNYVIMLIKYNRNENYDFNKYN